MAKVAFLGLGVMGFPMAGHLAKAGHDVTVYNRTAKKSEEWAGKHKGKRAATPAEAARGAEIVCCCVGNDDDLRSIFAGLPHVARCNWGALGDIRPADPDDRRFWDIRPRISGAIDAKCLLVAGTGTDHA